LAGNRINILIPSCLFIALFSYAVHVYINKLATIFGPGCG